MILLTNRRGRRRRQLMTVVVAWLFHLVLDGVWVREQTFLWPLFGTGFAPWPGGTAWSRASSDPWRFVKEGVGLRLPGAPVAGPAAVAQGRGPEPHGRVTCPLLEEC